MAFAGIGAAELLRHARPRGRPPAADRRGHHRRAWPGCRDWPWPEPRLTYANAILAEVHLAAGGVPRRPPATAAGQRLLAWLIAQETHEGHLSAAPVGGWAPGEARPGFDQQPIEAAAIADACARAAASRSDPQWTEGLHLAVTWFLGDNDAKVSMLDEETGGGADGLNRQGRSENQGAESTLALLSTLQHGRHLDRSLRGR